VRLLADENFPRAAVDALRVEGHDVAWVRTDAPGSTDEAVLSRAARESRLVVTFDKDFGDLALLRGTRGLPGVILFRLALTSPATVARSVVAALASRSDWAGHFSVVEPGRIRMRALPP
jgi:predicted nuclease of predicted toxin-antitoxin system